MHHKIRLREDPRIDYVMFFPEEMTIAAHYKNNAANPLEQEKENGKLKDRLKGVETLAELKSMFNVEKELLILRIFDKVKVLVETTTEFPLDIKCTLMFTKEDLEKYDKLKEEYESNAQAQLLAAQQAALIELPEKLDEEI